MVSGSGTSGDPYILSTLADLEQITTLGVNKYYKLGADIDASGTADPGYNSGAGWAPVNSFTGDFDGDGKTITGLTIVRASTDNVGFFGSGCNGTVHHVTFANVAITGRDNVGVIGSGDGGSGSKKLHYITVSGTIIGRNQVGGVIGSHVNGGAEYLTVNATVTGTGNSVGGCVGLHSANGGNYYDYCEYTGTLTGVSYVGGITGQSLCVHCRYCETNGDIYYTGSSVGGIAGKLDQNFTIDACIVNMVFHDSGTNNSIGGIVGEDVNGSIMNCEVYTDVVGDEYVGGLAGSRNGGNGNCTNNTVEGDITGTNYVGGMFGSWGQANSGGGSLNYSTYKGTITGTGNRIGGIVGTVNQKPYIHHITLDGDDVTIVTSATSDGVGGAVGWGYSIRLEYIDIINVDVPGRDSVGGIMGALDAWGFLFDHCTYQGGTITGRNYVGGIVGSGGDRDERIIQYCTTSGTITATGDRVGGIMGSANLDVFHCSSSMEITASGNNVGGLVGYTNYGAIVISYSDFTGTVHGAINVGGIAGALDRADASGGIKNCTVVTDEIHASGDTVGGLVGSCSHYYMKWSTFEGIINGVNNVGGLAGDFGYPYTQLKNCTVKGTINATGNKVAGAVGRIRYGASIENIYIDGTDLTISVSATSDYVGGIVGGDTDENYEQYLMNCHVDMDITGRDYVGGLVGMCKRLTFKGHNSYEGDVSGRSYIGCVCGAWGYPSTWFKEFASTMTASGTVTGTGSYIGGFIGGVYYGGYICDLDNTNITITATATSDYVGGIIGCHPLSSMYECWIFDCINKQNITGRNYIGGIIGFMHTGKIADCTSTGNITGTGYLGGVVGKLADGPNIEIYHCNVTANITGTEDIIGGIVGGTVLNAWNTAIKIEMCIYNGTIEGRDYVGGILGQHNCWYDFTSMIRRSYSIGSVSGRNYVGGVAGSTRSIISCYSLANVTGTDKVGGLIGNFNDGVLINCYAAGIVTGSTNKGGLVGYKAGTGTQEDCFWDTEITTQSTSALGTGKTTTEMETQNTFTNWDFINTWNIAGGYPTLQNHFPVIQSGSRRSSSMSMGNKGQSGWG